MDGAGNWKEATEELRAEDELRSHLEDDNDEQI